MRYSTKFFMVILIAFTLLSAPWQAVHAQDEIRFGTLEVDLWPEYDKPRQTLVIYRIDLSADVQLPASLTVRIPAAAGQPHAVAETQTAGDTLFNLQYTTRQDAQWVYVQFSASMPYVQIEYYDPGMTVNGDQRSITYRWAGDYPVDTLILQVQQPRTASGMQLTPALGQPQTNPQDGLTYYVASFDSVKAGETFELQVSYQKSDDALSVEGIQVVPSDSTQQVSPAFVWTDILPWVLGALGVLLIIGGGVWYWRGNQPSEEPKKRKHKRAAKSNAKVGSGYTEGAIYCPQCGKRADKGDRFCRACGAPLRRD